MPNGAALPSELQDFAVRHEALDATLGVIVAITCARCEDYGWVRENHLEKLLEGLNACQRRRVLPDLQ